MRQSILINFDDEEAPSSYPGVYINASQFHPWELQEVVAEYVKGMKNITRTGGMQHHFAHAESQEQQSVSKDAEEGEWVV